MGNNRATYKRRQASRAQDIVYFVHSVFRSYQLGFMNFPRCIYMYERALENALNGDMAPLELALKRVSLRGNLVDDKDNTNPTLTKWRGGMAAHFSNMYYVLSMFYQLLSEYHKVINDKPNILSKVSIKRPGFVPHKILSREGKEFSKHYQECEPLDISGQ